MLNLIIRINLYHFIQLIISLIMSLAYLSKFGSTTAALQLSPTSPHGLCMLLWYFCFTSFFLNIQYKINSLIVFLHWFQMIWKKFIDRLSNHGKLKHMSIEFIQTLNLFSLYTMAILIYKHTFFLRSLFSIWWRYFFQFLLILLLLFLF